VSGFFSSLLGIRARERRNEEEERKEEGRRRRKKEGRRRRSHIIEHCVGALHKSSQVASLQARAFLSVFAGAFSIFLALHQISILIGDSNYLDGAPKKKPHKQQQPTTTTATTIITNNNNIIIIT